MKWPRLQVVLSASIAVIIASASPAAPDVRQLFVATSYGSGSQNNKIFRIPLEGAQQGQLIEFANAADGISAPYTIEIHPSSNRLYVGNDGTAQVLEFEINADGTKGSSRVFGAFPYGFTSMAIRPSTGRIYIGKHISNTGVYLMAADGSSYEKIVDDPGGDLFYDECWIDFHPEDDSLLFVSTGFENKVRKFDADDGSDLGYLTSYDAMGWDPGPPPVDGHFLPHHFFLPAGGGQYDLIACVYHMDDGGDKYLLQFDPDLDVYDGVLPLAGPVLYLPPPILDFVYDEVTGKIYSGTCANANVYEIAGDFSSYVRLYGDEPDLPNSGHTRVAMSYVHSTGADTDGDGLTDDNETVFGTDPLATDSDADGYTDYEEVGHDGDASSYTAGNDTDPLDADTDDDDFSDLLEIASGSDPLAAGWTAADMHITVSFQPPESTRPAGCAVDTGWSFNADRDYGWQP